MKKYHNVSDAHFEGNEFVVNIDGKSMRYHVSQLSHILQNSSDLERNKFEISPSGYGIHWPDLDEDISIDGLLGIVHKRQPKKRAA